MITHAGPPEQVPARYRAARVSERTRRRGHNAGERTGRREVEAGRCMKGSARRPARLCSALPLACNHPESLVETFGCMLAMHA
jgi:hypothetical protein